MAERVIYSCMKSPATADAADWLRQQVCATPLTPHVVTRYYTSNNDVGYDAIIASQLNCILPFFNDSPRKQLN